MAVYSMTATQVVFNSQDHTSKVKSVQLSLEAEQLDTTNMSSSGWKEMIGGLKSGSATITFMDDFADNGLDEDVYDAVVAGVTITLTCKPTAAAISTSNPEFQVNVLPTTWEFGGGVGELAEKTLTWPTSGAWVRDVTA